MPTWRDYEITTSSAAPSGYSLFQTAYIDPDTKIITSFIDNGDKEIRKYVSSDHLSIRYLDKFVLPTMLMSFGSNSYIYSSSNSDNWANKLPTTGYYIYMAPVWSESCQAWFCVGDAVSDNKLFKSTDGSTWTAIQTVGNDWLTITKNGLLVVDGPAGEAQIWHKGINKYLYSTDSGASFIEVTHTFGVYGGFYVDSGWWVISYGSVYQMQKLTSISNVSVLATYTIDVTYLGTEPGFISSCRMDSGKYAYGMYASNKIDIREITSAPTANDYIGTVIKQTGDAGVMYLPGFRAISADIYAFWSAGGGPDPRTGRLYANNGAINADLEIYACWYDRNLDGGKWCIIERTTAFDDYEAFKVATGGATTTLSNVPYNLLNANTWVNFL